MLQAAPLTGQSVAERLQDLPRSGAPSQISADEMTGVQALEGKHAGLPLAPGQVERREFEHLRHGAQTLIISFDVTTGEVVSPSRDQTRAEEDSVDHIRGTVDAQPDVQRWHSGGGNLTILVPQGNLH